MGARAMSFATAELKSTGDASPFGVPFSEILLLVGKALAVSTSPKTSEGGTESALPGRPCPPSRHLRWRTR